MSAQPKVERDSAAVNFHLASRMADIQPFHVVEIFTRAGQLEHAGHKVISLCVGEPDFPTPAPIVAAAKQALDAQRFYYTASLGIWPLRQAISDFYRSRFAVSVEPERIAITTGASGALLLTLGVLVNPGERVLLTDPGYPCNFQFVRAFNGQPVGVSVGVATQYQLTAELIRSNWNANTVAALIASPANPTGTIVPRESMQEIIAAVHGLGGRLIVDEIYQGLTYDHEPSTVLSLSDEVFVINSFSKYFQMTGWRLGWMVLPKSYVREVEKLAQNLFISNSAMAQVAATAGFRPETIAIAESRREEFRRRRDYLIPALQQLGFGVPVIPQGAFYIYADCSKLTDDSYQFAWDLLEKAHVAITPGIDFGSHGAKQHVRLSYCTSMENLQDGVARMGRYLGR